MCKRFFAIFLIMCMTVSLIACEKGKEEPMSDTAKISAKLEKKFNQTTKSKLVHEAVLYVESTDGEFSESYGYNGRDIDTPMICASVTKLFTTACVLKLCEEGKLSLDDKLTKYFDDETLQGLHIYKGKEYSFDLTVSHLLFQTSGLPDSTEDGDNTELLKGDFFVTFEQNLDRTKHEIPPFAPGEGKRANYCNLNFDMLGLIIEQITGKSLADVYEEMIFTPLEMGHTYLAVDAADANFCCYYKDQKFYRPNIIASSGASGGCISTPRDLMAFSKGFWGGKLFDKAVFEKLDVYKGLQASKGPIQYGGGYMQVPMEGISNLFMGKGELIGHFGCTGSFVFYYPEKDIHMVGDLSEITDPSLPVRLIMQLAMTY